MKQALLVLAAWLGATQTVSFTTCACAVCERAGTASACPEEPGHGCCSGEAPAPKAPCQACFHTQPSSEIDIHSIDAVAPDLVEFPAEIADPPAPPDIFVFGPFIDPIPIPSRSSPLYLLDSALLI